MAPEVGTRPQLMSSAPATLGASDIGCGGGAHGLGLVHLHARGLRGRLFGRLFGRLCVAGCPARSVWQAP